MPSSTLITGGAGFIGSHLADALLAAGHKVRVLDNLEPQVHGQINEAPDYLHPDVEMVRGSLSNPVDLRRALADVDIVYHFAARVGVGQSMYQMVDYATTNTVGTAHLLEALLDHPVKKLVVASSMSVYGEGLYHDAGGQPVEGAQRTIAQLKRRVWEPLGPNGERLTMVPTPEWKQPDLSSLYALGKFDQERMCLLFGRAYDVPVTALRFFNVYGTRQALSNPYTGVLAIFASRLLNGNAPLIFEDGEQQRDFVHVKDVARACLGVLNHPETADQVYNIGSGRPITIRQVAAELSQVMGRPQAPIITSEYRAGDIRNCVADISKASRELGYEPRVAFSDGLEELAFWLAGQQAHDHTELANQELASRRLKL